MISGTQDGLSEVARRNRNEAGAWDKMRKPAKDIASLADILEQAWFAEVESDVASATVRHVVSGSAKDLPIAETLAAFRNN